jgi:hypothetical protein
MENLRDGVIVLFFKDMHENPITYTGKIVEKDKKLYIYPHANIKNFDNDLSKWTPVSFGMYTVSTKDENEGVIEWYGFEIVCNNSEHIPTLFGSIALSFYWGTNMIDAVVYFRQDTYETVAIQITRINKDANIPFHVKVIVEDMLVQYYSDEITKEIKNKLGD